jgi:hypothetical protein
MRCHCSVLLFAKRCLQLATACWCCRFLVAARKTLLQSAWRACLSLGAYSLCSVVTFVAVVRAVFLTLCRAHCALAGANGVNPVPGLDVAVDLAIMLSLGTFILDAFHLTRSDLALLKAQYGVIMEVVLQTAVEFGTEAGVKALLQKASTTIAVQRIVKWVPVVGVLVSCSLGAGLALWVGTTMLNRATELSEQLHMLMEEEFVKSADEVLHTVTPTAAAAPGGGGGAGAGL